ncbi:transposase [Planctobacterium marinum]|uniref:transposase n=1 Tax=Planctobacterium marinum TaxID=1631968 RepID=UPI001E3FE2E0|nr:transposase [Planctobacterium marinum]MCC2607880.1 transposase [Planctobacterium marinum]
MPKARKAQICLEDTPYYHCVSRCVRRAFLCGEDKQTGVSYEHRRQWVEDRIHFLSQIFAIDVCAYAVMSNHTHLVLHIHKDLSDSWDTEEVIRRWHRLSNGTLLSHQYLNPEQRKQIHESQLFTIEETADIWRKRLTDISWFMRYLNEYIAREANKEDKCSGRFWEGRFKSQALLDEAALAACMAYVDLNPIRAGMANTPEQSDHTSIQYRINAAKAGKTPKYLTPFAGNIKEGMPHGLPFHLFDYMELVDITGRAILPNKRGAIEESTPVIMERLNLKPEQWQELATQFEDCFHHAAGSESYLEAYRHRHNLKRLRDKNTAIRLFG